MKDVNVYIHGESFDYGEKARITVDVGMGAARSRRGFSFQTKKHHLGSYVKLSTDPKEVAAKLRAIADHVESFAK